MMSCLVAEEGVSLAQEGQCVWAEIGVRSFDQDRTVANIGISETATNFSGGVQVALSDHWFGGIGMRYEQVSSTIDTRASTEGDRFNFAGSLKGNWGNTTLATVVSGGFGDFDTSRFINLPGVSLTAEGDQDVEHAGLHARLSHFYDYGS
jgi:hypothetical protein